MNAPNASGWKPGAPQPPLGPAGIETTTGNRGLMLEEPLIFEIGGNDTCGVDFEILPELARGGGSGEAADGGVWPPAPSTTRFAGGSPSRDKLGADRLGGLARTEAFGLPGLSEPETVRHYTRLSRQNYAIDCGIFRSVRAR